MNARFARTAALEEAGSVEPAVSLPALTTLGGTPGTTSGQPGAPGESASFTPPAADGDGGVLPQAASEPVAAAPETPGMAVGEVLTTPQAGVAPTGLNTSAASYKVDAPGDRKSTSLALGLGLLAVIVLAAGDRIRIRRLTR